MATGDISEMWIRDSAVQLGMLLPRLEGRPSLRLLVEGAVRTQVCAWVGANGSWWQEGCVPVCCCGCCG